MMDTDIVILAVIACVLFAKLWSVLGRKNEGDDVHGSGTPPQFNPFSPKPKQVAEEEDDAPFRLTGNKDNTTTPPVVTTDGAGKTLAIAGRLLPNHAAPTSLLGVLEHIKSLNPNFDEKAFLAEAKQAFITIVEDFARGDLTRSLPILGARVLPHFQSAIAARQASGQTLDNTIIRIKDVETWAAKLDGTVATITVRFISEQKNCLRDASGAIIDGGNGVEAITDMWSFTHDTAQPASKWILAETKS